MAFSRNRAKASSRCWILDTGMPDTTRVGSGHDARDLVAVGGGDIQGATETPTKIIVLELRERRQLIKQEQMDFCSLVLKNVIFVLARGEEQSASVVEIPPLGLLLVDANALWELRLRYQDVVLLKLRKRAPKQVGLQARYAHGRFHLK